MFSFVSLFSSVSNYNLELCQSSNVIRVKLTEGGLPLQKNIFVLSIKIFYSFSSIIIDWSDLRAVSDTNTCKESGGEKDIVVISWKLSVSSHQTFEFDFSSVTCVCCYSINSLISFQLLLKFPFCSSENMFCFCLWCTHNKTGMHGVGVTSIWLNDMNKFFFLSSCWIHNSRNAKNLMGISFRDEGWKWYSCCRLMNFFDIFGVFLLLMMIWYFFSLCLVLICFYVLFESENVSSGPEKRNYCFKS